MKKNLLLLVMSLSMMWSFAQTTISTTDTLYLEDRPEISISGVFVENEVVGDVSKIDSLITSFEHTYIGDLVVSLMCPDSTEVIIFDGNDANKDLDEDGNTNSQGYFLGIPFSDEDGIEGAGEGWTYSFKTGPSQLLTDGSHHEVTTQDDEKTGQSIEGGTYKIKGDFSELIDCPLNGEWKIKIKDELIQDDGYLFGWSLILQDDTTTVNQPNPYDSPNQTAALTTTNSDISDFSKIDSVKIISYTYVNENTTNVTWRIYDDTNTDISLNVTTPNLDIYELSLTVSPTTRAEKKSVLKVKDYIDTRVFTNMNVVENNNINIYPNPTNDIITIEGDNITYIEIKNIKGQIITKKEVDTNKLTMDISTYKKGIYFVKIVENDKSITKKIILE